MSTVQRWPAPRGLLRALSTLPWPFSKLLSIHPNETTTHMGFHSLPVPGSEPHPHRWAPCRHSLRQFKVKEGKSDKSNVRN